jgi:uncharacterized protein
MTLDDLWRALALMAVLEGFLYAVAPEAMKRMLAAAQSQSADALRLGGLAIAALGVGCLWLLK